MSGDVERQTHPYRLRQETFCRVEPVREFLEVDAFTDPVPIWHPDPTRTLALPTGPRDIVVVALTPLEPQSRVGDKLLEVRMVCPQNGTAVLKGLSATRIYTSRATMNTNYWWVLITTIINFNLQCRYRYQLVCSTRSVNC